MGEQSFSQASNSDQRLVGRWKWELGNFLHSNEDLVLNANGTWSSGSSRKGGIWGASIYTNTFFHSFNRADGSFSNEGFTDIYYLSPDGNTLILRSYADNNFKQDYSVFVRR